MIPKIIHYTWFSNEPFPQQVEECIKSWHQYMPDWEYKLWDMSAIETIDSCWLDETLKMKKWAFAADFVRVYAVYHYGGIYLDTDVVVYKSFDALLSNHAFIGRESFVHISLLTENHLTSHCFGAEKGNQYIRMCLEYYKNRHFILSGNEQLPIVLRYDMKLMPFIQSELAKCLGYESSALADYIQDCRFVTIYPTSYFGTTQYTPLAYCKHLALGAWRENRPLGYHYTWLYKVEWRVFFIVEKILRKFNYIIIKLR